MEIFDIGKIWSIKSKFFSILDFNYVLDHDNTCSKLNFNENILLFG
jgi:hypothetical protein